MSLQDQGFRFVVRPSELDRALWLHPADMKPGDIDCTDMGDEEFEALIEDLDRQAAEEDMR